MSIISLFRLNPRRNWVSRRASLLHNIRLISEAVLVASAITTSWYCCHIHKWPFHVQKDGDKVMLTTCVLVCAAIFAVIGAFLFMKAGERNSKAARALLLKDQQSYLLLRDDKIPIRMHVVMALFCIEILTLLFVADYETPATGALLVFTVSMGLVTYFVAIVELQDIIHNAWFRERTPSGWATMSLDEHFELVDIIKENNGEI